MTRRERVDSEHHREVSANGRKSTHYKTDGFFSWPVEYADHHEDGTTDSYEVNNSLFAGIFEDYRGKKKNK